MNEPSLFSSTWSKIRVRHELEREVDVADLDPEQRLDQPVVDPRVDRTERTLTGPVEAVGADDVDLVVAQQPDRTWEFGHVEREIRVGVEHEITCRSGESGLHRTAQLAVAFVMDHPDPWVRRRQSIGDLGRASVDLSSMTISS